MSRRILMVLPVLLLLTGCASEKFVTDRTDPLSDRLSNVEIRLNALENKVNNMGGAEPVEAAMSEEDEQRMMDAVRRAENAAKRAEEAARKSEKAFELRLKK